MWQHLCNDRLALRVCPQTCRLCSVYNASTCKDTVANNGCPELVTSEDICNNEIAIHICPVTCNMCGRAATTLPSLSFRQLHTTSLGFRHPSHFTPRFPACFTLPASVSCAFHTPKFAFRFPASVTLPVSVFGALYTPFTLAILISGSFRTPRLGFRRPSHSQYRFPTPFTLHVLLFGTVTLHGVLLSGTFAFVVSISGTLHSPTLIW